MVTKFIGLNKADEESYASFGKRIIEKNISDADSVNRINEILEKDKFSRNNISNEEIKEFNDIVIRISKNVYMKLSWYKKLLFRYIKWL